MNPIKEVNVVAGKKLMDMLKFIQNNIKQVKDKDMRNAIESIDHTKIFKNEISIRDIVTIMKVYRDLPK